MTNFDDNTASNFSSLVALSENTNKNLGGELGGKSSSSTLIVASVVSVVSSTLLEFFFTKTFLSADDELALGTLVGVFLMTAAFLPLWAGSTRRSVLPDMTLRLPHPLVFLTSEDIATT